MSCAAVAVVQTLVVTAAELASTVGVREHVDLLLPGCRALVRRHRFGRLAQPQFGEDGIRAGEQLGGGRRCVEVPGAVQQTVGP